MNRIGNQEGVSTGKTSKYGNLILNTLQTREASGIRHCDEDLEIPSESTGAYDIALYF